MSLARLLGPADVEALRALRLRGLQEHPLEFGADYNDELVWPMERWRERLKEVSWFGVERDGALIACGFVRFMTGRKLRHNGWINAMYVVAEAHGSAAGDALMDAIEDAARQHGATHLKLYVRDGNARAVAFYRRRGFVPYGIEPDSHIAAGVSYHSLEMCRILPEPAG